MDLTFWFAAAALCIGSCSVALGQITGVVKLNGDPPMMQLIREIANDPSCARLRNGPAFEEKVLVGPNGELQNVVVSIKPGDGQKLARRLPDKPAILDQKDCIFQPHVVAVTVGQELDIKNSDRCVHTAHLMCVKNPNFNIVQTAPGIKKLDPLKTPETFEVKCEAHLWMAAWVRVLDNSYFGVTDVNGGYRIDTTGLADGDYTLVFWHETFGEKEQKVTIKNGKGIADFTFKVAATAGG